MYAAALSLSAVTTAGTTGMPFFHLGALDVGIPIQAFGVIVAAGVLIGAALLRRYAEWHGVSDETIRGLTGWITVTGFIGAHVFDVLAYQWPELEKDPLLLVKIWAGISSYGGFIGGAMGFAFYVWWKRLPGRLMADIAIVGLLPAFSIGRIGCTVVSDHIGAAVDPTKWYAFLAMDYPRTYGGVAHLVQTHPATDHATTIAAWNLGFIEFLYLVPVNALLLYLAFRRKRINAGILIAMTGVLYAPVRFFLDYLRPETSDPRYAGFTFAQWSSFLAFGAAAYLATRLMKGGAPAETIAPTASEAQEKLRVVLKDVDAEVAVKEAADKKKKAEKALPVAKVVEPKAKAEPSEPDPVAEAKRAREEAEDLAAAERRAKQDAEYAVREAARKEAEAAAAAAKAASPAEGASTTADASGDKGGADKSGKKAKKK